MTFAPVKSNPYAKRAPRRRARFQLWSGQFWNCLVRMVLKDWSRKDLNEQQIAAIRDENSRLYGEGL